MEPSRFTHPRRPSPFPGSQFTPAPQNAGGNRPLSDIKEITEPSLLESLHHRHHAGVENAGGRPLRYHVQRHQTPEPLQPRTNAHQAQRAQAGYTRPESRNARPNPSPSSRPGSRQNHRSAQTSPDSHRSSLHSIPLENVPPRSSSRQQYHRPSQSLSREPAVSLHNPPHRLNSVSNRGQSRSPVKEVISRLVPENRIHRVPSRTIIRAKSGGSSDILDHPSHQHPRLRVALQVAAPLFVGGSSAEGIVRLVVDEAERVRHRKLLTLERVSVDLIGIEEVSGSRRHIFLALGNEIIDDMHPPPIDMIQSNQPQTSQGRSWILVSSVSVLPFLISLPLEVGPPPFQSKHARIRYVLSVSVMIKDAGRSLCVRCTQDTSVLSVYDPEKALVSLPSPLTASDEFNAHHGLDRVIATAGLHRQVWVSGTSIFADVHIVNESRKKIKKLELQLERIILCYRHAAAATMEMSASQARLFDQSERTIICKSTIRHGTQGWNGVLPHTNDLRTCHLEVPRGHATIKCYKYFEVRYYLNIIVGTAHTKLAMVQLPIILIHMNSLDVPTNSVAQVAAAIEEKRANVSAAQSRTHAQPQTQTRHPPRHTANAAGTTAQGSPHLYHNPSRLQGRAFAAPRMASLERQRAHAEDLSQLRHAIDTSPRRHMARVSRKDVPSALEPQKALQPPPRLPPLPPPPQLRANLDAGMRYEPPVGLRYDGATSGSDGSPSANVFGFKTPPSKRKGRVLNEDEMGGLRERLSQRPEGADKRRNGKEKAHGRTRSDGGSNVTDNTTRTSTRWAEPGSSGLRIADADFTMPRRRAATAMGYYGRRGREDGSGAIAVDESTMARLEGGFRAKLNNQRSFGSFEFGSSNAKYAVGAGDTGNGRMLKGSMRRAWGGGHDRWKPVWR